MKNRHSVRYRPDGTVDTIYEDGLAEKLGGKTEEVRRASNVEFENIDGRQGWTVRAAHDPTLALRTTDWCRWAPSREGTVVTFHTREEALAEEVKFFWDILEEP